MIQDSALKSSGKDFDVKIFRTDMKRLMTVDGKRVSASIYIEKTEMVLLCVETMQNREEQRNLKLKVGEEKRVFPWNLARSKPDLLDDDDDEDEEEDEDLHGSEDEKAQFDPLNDDLQKHADM